MAGVAGGGGGMYVGRRDTRTRAEIEKAGALAIAEQERLGKLFPETGGLIGHIDPATGKIARTSGGQIIKSPEDLKRAYSTGDTPSAIRARALYGISTVEEEAQKAEYRKAHAEKVDEPKALVQEPGSVITDEPVDEYSTLPSDMIQTPVSPAGTETQLSGPESVRGMRRRVGDRARLRDPAYINPNVRSMRRTSRLMGGGRPEAAELMGSPYEPLTPEIQESLNRYKTAWGAYMSGIDPMESRPPREEETFPEYEPEYGF